MGRKAANITFAMIAAIYARRNAPNKRLCLGDVGNRQSLEIKVTREIIEVQVERSHLRTAYSIPLIAASQCRDIEGEDSESMHLDRWCHHNMQGRITSSDSMSHIHSHACMSINPQL